MDGRRKAPIHSEGRHWPSTRLYDEGKNAEEIAAVVRRPVALMEKWIRNFKIIDQKRQARNG